MTEYAQYTSLTPRQQEIKWLNIVHETHDQFCSCNSTLEHLLSCINQQNNPTKLQKKDIKKQLCLLTGETTEQDGDPAGDAVDALDFGDLEELFSENIGEPEDG